MENNYDLQRLWQLSNEHGDNVSIGSYAGNASLVVFKKGGNKPEIKLSLPVCYANEIKRLAKQLVGSNPGTKLPFIQMTYDSATKAYNKATMIIFEKNDKKQCSIELSAPGVAAVKFEFRCRGVFTNGADPMSQEARSRAGVEEFIYVLDKQLPVAGLLTRFNLPKFPSRGTNNGPAKQHQTSEGYRKQAPSSDPFSGGDDDLGDLF